MPLNFIETGIKFRIQQILDHKCVSVKDLCAKHGINHRSLVEQLSQPTAKLGYCLIFLIAEQFPDVSTDWLLTGKGQMLKDLTATKSVPALEMRIAELEYLVETQRKVIALKEQLESLNK